MIKANELRLGNLVNYNEGGEYEIFGISEYGIDVKNDEEETYMEYENFSPIPLTKQRLYEMGAKDFPDGESLILKGRLIGFAECRNIYFDIGTGIDLKNVHQYQNLIFELTGIEIN